jgi:hypothetical protein
MVLFQLLFIKILLLIFLFFFSIGYSQETLPEALEYYPLDNGNYWEYMDYYYNNTFPPFESETKYFSVKIIGDTIIENKTYKIKEYRNLPETDIKGYEFERVDSIFANVYKYDFIEKREFLIDSLLSQPGDSCKAIRGGLPQNSNLTICTNIVQDSVLGQITKVKQFWNIAFIPGFQYKLAKGFGYYGDDNCEFTCGGTKLLYTEINGVSYGSKVNSIDSKYPTHPNNIRLSQNYPNPFNSNSIVEFELPHMGFVHFELYNLLGKKVQEIYSGTLNIGKHRMEIHGDELSTGIYYYIIRTTRNYSSKKCLLLK